MTDIINITSKEKLQPAGLVLCLSFLIWTINWKKSTSLYIDKYSS